MPEFGERFSVEGKTGIFKYTGEGYSTKNEKEYWWLMKESDQSSHAAYPEDCKPYASAVKQKKGRAARAVPSYDIDLSQAGQEWVERDGTTYEIV